MLHILKKVQLAWDSIFPELLILLINIAGKEYFIVISLKPIGGHCYLENVFQQS